MQQLSRRQFGFQVAGALGLAALSGPASASLRRKLPFTMDLVCGAIGVRAGLPDAIQLASKHGFESVAPDAGYLARLSAAEVNALVQDLRQQKLKWGASGLPVEFRKDEETFRRTLSGFPKLAAALRSAGVTRVGTWIRPFHAELTYVANFRQHARRLRECVKVMNDHGLRFGMEYVGTKTLWTSTRHSFIHSMAEAKELIAEINQPSVGFVLDSWHWHTAGETTADLRTLTNADIVACDLNDAPKGVPVDELIDDRRELPAATGVIDLKGFLSTLADIGYDGPIRAEPFNAPLNKLDNDAACAATSKALRTAFQLAEKQP